MHRLPRAAPALSLLALSTWNVAVAIAVRVHKYHDETGSILGVARGCDTSDMLYTRYSDNFIPL
jgi:hypothetical protein